MKLLVSKFSVFISLLRNYFPLSTYIYMVIEHSLMNKSYTAKIDITNLLRTYNETKIAKTKQDYLKKDKIL